MKVLYRISVVSRQYVWGLAERSADTLAGRHLAPMGHSCSSSSSLTFYAKVHFGGSKIASVCEPLKALPIVATWGRYKYSKYTL